MSPVTPELCVEDSLDHGDSQFNIMDESTRAEGIGNHEEEKEDVCKSEEEEEEKLRTRLAQLPFPGRRSKDLKVLKQAQ